MDRKDNNYKTKLDRIPDQKELEKELSDYLSKKYKGRIKVMSPFLFPHPDEEHSNENTFGKKSDSEITFDLLPEELESYLDSFIVKQNQAKATLSTKICTHFNRIKFMQKNKKAHKKSGIGMIKNNVLLIGPTGVGKTYIVRLIAQKLGVPFVKGDATKFSETGYVGGDVEDLVRDLVYEANGDIDLAENGIIYIDEIDKIASARNLIGHDISRTGVQRALLKPMEETEIELKVPHDPVSQMQAIEQFRKTGKIEKKVVNTKNILFIMSGAFGDLAEIINKRLQKQCIGFEADIKSNEIPWEIMKEIKAQDLINFGFESEFVGRLPVIVVFDELTKDDMLEILVNPNNPIIISKRLDFKAYGIDIKFEEKALEKIAERAAEQKTGARGIVSSIENILIPFEKKLPSTNICRLLLTPEIVDKPEIHLNTLLENDESPKMISRFKKACEKEKENIINYISRRSCDFQKKSGLEINKKRKELITKFFLNNFSDINTAFDDYLNMYKDIKKIEAPMNAEIQINLTFDESAVDAIIDLCITTDQKPVPLTLELIKRLEYGLALVKEKSGLENFTINDEAVMDMENYLNNMIKKYYSNNLNNKYIEVQKTDKQQDD